LWPEHNYTRVLQAVELKCAWCDERLYSRTWWTVYIYYLQK